MCTLIAAIGIWSRAPLLVLANRDERLDRPWSAPTGWMLGPRRAFAPRDDVAGGTWLGINDRGVCAGITNRAGASRDPSRRSRGRLVLDALAAPDVTAAADGIAAAAPATHNGFHLLLVSVVRGVSEAGAHLVWSDGTFVRRRRLGNGIHVVTERSLGAASSAEPDPPARESRVRAALAPLTSGPLPPDRTWEELLAGHGTTPLGGTCVHAPERNYGTRSSTILRWGSDGALASYRHASGPPCSTPYRDLTTEARAALTS